MSDRVVASTRLWSNCNYHATKIYTTFASETNKIPFEYAENFNCYTAGTVGNPTAISFIIVSKNIFVIYVSNSEIIDKYFAIFGGMLRR